MRWDIFELTATAYSDSDLKAAIMYTQKDAMEKFEQMSMEIHRQFPEISRRIRQHMDAGDAHIHNEYISELLDAASFGYHEQLAMSNIFCQMAHVLEAERKLKILLDIQRLRLEERGTSWQNRHQLTNSEISGI